MRALIGIAAAAALALPALAQEAPAVCTVFIHHGPAVDSDDMQECLMAKIRREREKTGIVTMHAEWTHDQLKVAWNEVHKQAEELAVIKRADVDVLGADWPKGQPDRIKIIVRYLVDVKSETVAPEFEVIKRSDLKTWLAGRKEKVRAERKAKADADIAKREAEQAKLVAAAKKREADAAKLVRDWRAGKRATPY